MVPRTGYSWFLLLTWTITALSHDAHAHPNHGPSWGERYLKLEISNEQMRVVYGLTFSARYGRQVREIADRDDSGVITPNETKQFGTSFTKKLAVDVGVNIDDNLHAVEWTNPFVATLEGKLRRGPVALETTAKIKLTPGRHRVVLTDRAEFEGIYRTTVKFVAGDETKLLKAGRGPRPRRKDLRLVFLDLPEEGPPPQRVLSAEFELPGSTQLLDSPALEWIVPGGVCVLVLLVSGFVVRRFLRKGRSATEPGRDT